MFRRPAYPNHYWQIIGEEGHLKDEVGQSCRSIRHSGGDEQDSRWCRCQRDLAIAIIHNGKVPNDWEQSFIVSLYKGKGDALDRGNYQGLKLTEQKRGLSMVPLDRWCLLTTPSLALSQEEALQMQSFCGLAAAGEKYLAVNKRLYMAFVDLEKVFDCVPRKVIWWALRKLGVEEWIVWLVQGMYANAWSRVHGGDGFSQEFEVKVGVHQGSVLRPLLFIIVL